MGNEEPPFWGKKVIIIHTIIVLIDKPGVAYGAVFD